jgi:hypothetical protein
MLERERKIELDRELEGQK